MPKALLTLNDGAAPPDTLLLRPGKNLNNGESKLASTFGQLTSLEIDLLNLSAAVYACDLAFKRGDAENFTRQIEITLPVTNTRVFNSVQNQIIYLLYRLSDDTWKINFQPREGIPEGIVKYPESDFKEVLLFSGGLDSLSAAIIRGHANQKVRLVSHITANQVIGSAQSSLFEDLNSKFPGIFERDAFRIGCTNRPEYPFPVDQEREETQRTRSFLFLTLAAIVARRLSIPEIVMIAENGQMAIHLPLTSARISAFSTHTAHPEFVNCMAGFLSQLLSYDIKILNPFLYLTKAQVIAPVIGEIQLLKTSVSCWRSARMSGTKNHCGACVPCMIRRIALEYDGTHLDEYQRDIFTEQISMLDPDDVGKRNFIELAEFVTALKTISSPGEAFAMFPDLINPHFDADKALLMYRTFAEEATNVFNRYPSLKSVIC